MSHKTSHVHTPHQPLSIVARTARAILRRRANADGILEGLAGLALLDAGLTFREAYGAIRELRMHGALVSIDTLNASTIAHFESRPLALRRYFLP